MKLLRKLKKLFGVYRQLSKIEKTLVHSSLEALKKNDRYKDNKSLIPYGYKIYSQNDEDGIIQEIFDRIGTTNKFFVEFGIGNGLENNTYALLFDGWRGLWIEGSNSAVNNIREGLKETINNDLLAVTNAFITKDNINNLISASVKNKEIDLLSIDIDGNDIHIFNHITCINPRVVIIEYNSKFAPPIKYCRKYEGTHIWEHDDNYGASLKHLELEFSKKGYNLVACNITGSNAFFIREDLTDDKFQKPYSAETHYEPARHHLSGFASGHESTFNTLEDSVK
ncbi:MAG: hypothetical protein R8G33_10945 [Gammaproteobacteria bacterium]|nr:hypothetical protein [Gammaproteobacteria bacterium]